MNLIELHILQSFPVTCLNRDDLGAPKSAIFGGVSRARVSSQSWKRAVRQYLKEIESQAFFSGQRTRYILRQLNNNFLEKGFTDDQATVLAQRLAEALGKLDSLEKGNVKTLLFFSPQEISNAAQNIADAEISSALKTLLDESATKKAKDNAATHLDKAAKKAAKSLADSVKDAADIAIFGRMVADDHSLTLEGAGLFSHALSTHRVSNEIDFFSAVDDLKPLDEEGAGHIGTLEFNSATYYRYVGLNIDLLFDERHLGHFEAAERASVLEAFLRASVLAVPTARKNSMFGFTPPDYILGLRRRGQPLSLINAFEAAIRPSAKGYGAPSAEALESHFDKFCRTYGLDDHTACRVPDLPLEQFITTLIRQGSEKGDLHD